MTSTKTLTGITAHARGSALSVTVVPRSSMAGLQRMDDGSLRARVTAAPVDGAANSALLRYLSDVLHVPRSRLTLDSGESSRRKRIVVAGVTPEALERRIRDALRGTR